MALRTFLLAALLPTLAVAAPARTKVAIPPASGIAADKETANTLAELVAAEIGKDPRLSVTTSADIAALLGVEAQRQLLDCDANASSSCLADIGGALGVDFVVSMQVGRLEETRLVTGSLVSTKGARAITRVVERIDHHSPIDQAATRLARQLRDALLVEHARLHPEKPGAVAFPVTLAASIVVALVGGGAVGLAWMSAAAHEKTAAEGNPQLTWPQAQALTTQAGIGWGGVGVGALGIGAAFILFGPGEGSAGDGTEDEGPESDGP